jgi:hypothetical protein
MSTALVSATTEAIVSGAGEIIVVDGGTELASYQASGTTQASAYQFEIYDGSNQLIADLSPYARSRHFTVRRNRAEQVGLVFDQGQLENLAASVGLTVRQILEPGVNDIVIRRGNRALVRTRVQYLLPTLSATGRSVEVRAVGYLDLFKDRYIWPSDANDPLGLKYTSADIGAVAWNFLNLTQSRINGSFGVTMGTIQTSRTITDTWQPYATSIRDILIALTERNNSIDFEFAPDKTFKVYYPGIGTEKADLRFSFPGNIRELSLPVDASELANYIIARGGGNGDTQVAKTYPTLPVTTAEQAIYRLREVIDDYPSITVEATLTEKATEHYRKSSTPTVIPELTLDGNIEPYLGAYWIGDRVPVAIDTSAGSLYRALDGQTWRINEIDVALTEDDNETVRLKVGYS